MNSVQPNTVTDKMPASIGVGIFLVRIMRHYFYIYLICSFWFLSCSQGPEVEEKIGLKDIKFQNIEVNSLLELMEIEMVIKPESLGKSIIGQVDGVQFTDDGDLYIGDYRSTRRVLRFNKKGKFIGAYGKIGEAPGEFAAPLAGFSVIGNKINLFSSLRVVSFLLNGEPVDQKRLGYRIRKATLFNKQLYLNIPFYRDREAKYSNLILDGELKEVGGIGRYDKRLLKYKFLPENNLSSDGKLICCTDIYDWGYTIYDEDGDVKQRFIEPRVNGSLDHVWRKTRISEDDRDLVKKSLKNFCFVHIYKNNLLLLNCCAGEDLYSYWLLNHQKKEAYVVDYNGFDFEGAIHFNRIIGSCSKGFIGVVSDSENFNKNRHKYPVFENIELTAEDNPLIVIFRIKERFS